MKQRLLCVVLSLLCLGIPLFAQGTSRFFYPVKIGPLEPGDKLKISIVNEPQVLPPFYGMRMYLNVVILGDNKLGRIIPVGFPGYNETRLPLGVPRLDDMQAGGLTIIDLQKMIEQRFAQENFKTVVAVEFTGSVVR